MRLVFVLGLMPFAAAALAQEAPQVPPIEVQQIFSGGETAAGQKITLPQGEVQVGVSIYTIQPGARLPVHKHPYPRYAYVLAGTIDVTDAETGRTTAYKPGDVILEMIDRWHFGENKGSEPIRLLVVDQAPKGAPTTVIKPD